MQVKHIGYVSANIGLFFIEEHSHLFCIQPHGLSFQLDIKLGLAILALVDDDFVARVCLLHGFLRQRKLQIFHNIVLAHSGISST